MPLLPNSCIHVTFNILHTPPLLVEGRDVGDTHLVPAACAPPRCRLPPATYLPAISTWLRHMNWRRMKVLFARSERAIWCCSNCHTARAKAARGKGEAR